MRRLAVPVLFGVALAVAACDDGSDPKVLVIGDSIMNQSAFETARHLDDAGWKPVVDAVGGTEVQPDAAFDTDWPAKVEELTRGNPPEVAVIELGTNDCLSTDTNLAGAIDGLMKPLGDVQQVIWLNSPTVPCPRLDKALAAASGRYDNLAVIDAAEHFRGHPEWIASDGIHLSPAGRREIGRLVADSTFLPPI
ncbi:MAG: GDSL-type esterase/lipase family protein [Acidimicrobiia bacterium]